MPDIQTFLIVCPLVLLAGFVDAIGGGGGLISLPAYLLAGLPAHTAIATNKLSSTCGTALATVRFARRGLMHWRMAWPSMAAGLAGSWCGAHLSMLVDSAVLERVLYLVLPLTALLVLRKDALRDEAPRREDGGRRTALIAAGASLLIGVYDGFYGPGTGTFLILFLTTVARMRLTTANGITKAINFSSNIAALTVFLIHGQAIVPLGLTAGVFSVVGNYLGTRVFDKKGARAVKPVMLTVIAVFFVKVLYELLSN